ncbi:Dcp1p-Dcp2p decapping enzyme complex alpha subunit [Lunasporangiospora selenospora]|uniref:mRNA guanylyltransferase n=1 Tax=Lunasporangiospora selenospora TaxID=979761 RepID=A0A9P6KDI7_9FUNG|nr:Dcp1p-Dcp2p decapping enzyme complex alpha subunit [Lunasporangiospora selenospora]
MVTRHNIQRPKANLQKLGRVRKQALKSNSTSRKSIISTNIQHVRRISKKKSQQKDKKVKYILDSALVKAGGVKEATMKEAPMQKEEIVVVKAIPSGPGTTLGAPSDRMPADSVIPDIPGVHVDPRTESMLRERICRVIGINGNRFIGAQPVSFTRNTLRELQSEDYFVSEKSDGVRVLLYCVTHENGQQQVFLVDRKNKFSYVPQLRFPVAGEPNVLHSDTIVDGELVSDLEPDGQRLVRYLAFDLIAYRGHSITEKPFRSRLGRLQSEFITPYREQLKTAHPQFINSQPFRVSLKEINLSYGIDKMFREVIPNLKHGTDGLMFTSAIAPYVPSTNSKMLKWKPPSENTIDFKLSMVFPQANGSTDYSARPRFLLMEWLGGQNYTQFGEMTVDDAQWEDWKSSSTVLHNRIVEVNFTPQDRGWRFFRFRDDKEHGNHTSVVRKVVESIRDGVEKDEGITTY